MIKKKGLRKRLKDLIETVFLENIKLKKSGLVVGTWGNVSGIDRKEAIIAIKPSGVPYEAMRKEDIVLVDLEGKSVESTKNASSDLPTHLCLYKNFQSIGGVVHTHSTYATAFAQAKRSVPCLGTTHADYCFGKVPITEELTSYEIKENYEHNTGEVIVRSLKKQKIKYEKCPFVLVSSHGPFVWGKDSGNAVENAITLESIAKMAFLTLMIYPSIKPISPSLLAKHFFRKHGSKAYYGQKK
jgi:L-ribulose-5-phosphate 4-epimerase